MKKSKEEKGITLISVIIAVILLSILVGITTYSGIQSYKNAKVTKFITQMQLIQTKVDEFVREGNINIGAPGADYQDIITLAFSNHEISTNNAASFKYFTIENLNDQFELDNIDTPVLINFSTREVVSTEGIEFDGEMYYTQYLLEDGQQLFEKQIDSNIELEGSISKEIDGLNCLVRIEDVTINAKLSYGELVEEEVLEWETITDCTKANEDYTVNISKSGNYVFKITHNETNTSMQETVNIVLTNKPKTNLEIENYDYFEDSTKWAFVAKPTEIDNKYDYYIWIPRFAINNTTDDIKYIKGNSNIATDNTYLTIGVEENEWSIPSIFKNNNQELTGIWIKVTARDNLSITNLVNMENPTILNEIMD